MIKDYFKKIDTQEKAYWLGFLYADGCVSKDFKSIIMQLHIQDIKHIERFKKDIDSHSDIKISKDGKYAKIVVCCKEMCMDLNDKGCVPAKSLILEYPSENIVPKELIIHFIRGYFDGDGCISYTEGYRKRPDLKSDKLYLRKKWDFKIVGTYSMMNGIAKELNLTNKLYNQIKGKNNYTLKCGGTNKVRDIMSRLYNNSTVHLERKYEKYLLI